MKINSELPNCLLSSNNELNDYDFVLYHLYESNDIYREYYRKQRLINPDRLMILDNSAYEFYIKNEKLNIDRFIETISELNPDMYILPDTLMDKNKTLRDTQLFMEKISDKHLKSKPLAVAQGVSVKEMLECLDQYIKWGINNIAIPFHNSFFKELGRLCDESILYIFKETYRELNDDLMYAMGRVQFVKNYNDILKQFDHVHFLGSHCPLEKTFYKEYNTMDTGYPVKLAISGVTLFKEQAKPNVIIDDFLDEELDESIKSLIKHNVELFKSL